MPDTPHQYLTVSDMVRGVGARLCPLLGLAQGTPVETHPALLDRIEETNALIHTYLRLRHTQPLATIDPSLRSAAVKITVWHLASVADKHQLRETDRDNYDDAIKYLEELRDGTMSLTYEPENRVGEIAVGRAAHVGANDCNAFENKSSFQAF